MPEKVEFPSVRDMMSALLSGRVSPKELFNDLRDQILHHESSISGFIHVADDFPSGVKAGGKLAGLPFAVKDIIDTEGMPTSYGSLVFDGNIPEKDATVVKRLKNAGGTIQGKTATHEFAIGIVTPQVRNPWDRRRMAGGSSGGSAVAVAAGLSPFTLGTDTAGSVRIPSGLCGITGLKPTTGSLPLEGIFPEAWSLDTVGPMCRYASDIPFILEQMGFRFSRKEIESTPSGAVITELLDAASHEVRKVFNAFIDRMSSEGIAEIHEISIPDIEDIAYQDDLIDSAENAFIHRDLFSRKSDRYTSQSRMQLEKAFRITAADFILAQKKREETVKRFRKLFRSVDLLLTPISPTTAPAFSELKGKKHDFYMRYMLFTCPFSFTGNPAIAIPIGFSGGMPVGAQLAAGHGMDLFLCSVAERYQDTTEYHIMFPDTFAGSVRKGIPASLGKN